AGRFAPVPGAGAEASAGAPLGRVLLGEIADDRVGRRRALDHPPEQPFGQARRTSVSHGLHCRQNTPPVAGSSTRRLRSGESTTPEWYRHHSGVVSQPLRSRLRHDGHRVTGKGAAMTVSRTMVAGGLVAAVLAFGAVRAQQPLYFPKQADRPSPIEGDEPGFTPIFDGQSLKGWEGDPTYWRGGGGGLGGGNPPGAHAQGHTLR